MARILLIIFIIASWCAACRAEISFATMEGVAANVGGTKITMSRFFKAVELSGEELVKKLSAPSVSDEAGTREAAEREDNRTLVRSTVLQQLIDWVLIENGARREGIKVADSEIRAEIEVLKDKFPSSAEFHRSIAEQGMTVDDLKKNIRRQLVVEGLQKLLRDRLVVSDEEIEDFYEKNLEIFVHPRKVAVNRIVVEDRELAGKIRREIDEGKEQNWEDLGYVERGDLAPPVEDFAFCVRPGSVSEVIGVENECHIIRVVDWETDKETTLRQAKANIRDFLLKEKGVAAFTKWLDDQRFLTDIVINSELRELVEQGHSSNRRNFSIELTLS